MINRSFIITLLLTFAPAVLAQTETEYPPEVPQSNAGGKGTAKQMPLLQAVGANTIEEVHALPGITPNPNWMIDSNHPTARKALNLNNKWRYNDADVSLDDKSGTLTYEYGAAEHLIICAPLRFCTISLEPGEQLLYPALADQERWQIGFTFSGPPNMKTVHVSLKPEQSGLRTALTLTTDRRFYTLRLLSDEERYMTNVNFSYRGGGDYMQSFNDFQQQFNAYAAPAQTASVGTQSTTQNNSSEYSLKVDNLYFDYDVKGDSSIKPKRVFDDGVKTYIEFDPRIQELPTLLVKTGWRKRQIVNSTNTNGYTYRVDALFDKAELLVGVGWTKKKVTIARNDPHVAN